MEQTDSMRIGLVSYIRVMHDMVKDMLDTAKYGNPNFDGEKKIFDNLLDIDRKLCEINKLIAKDDVRFAQTEPIKYTRPTCVSYIWENKEEVGEVIKNYVELMNEIARNHMKVLGMQYMFDVDEDNLKLFKAINEYRDSLLAKDTNSAGMQLLDALARDMGDNLDQVKISRKDKNVLTE